MSARWLRPTGVVLAFSLLALGLLALAGVAPGEALSGVIRGAMGDATAWAHTARTFVPLALCGLGVCLAFRAGLWNIGAEGQFVAGALAAFGAARLGASWPLLLVAGVGGGAAWAAIAAALRELRGVPEVLSTIMLNFVAIELSDALVTGAWQEPSGRYPETELLADAALLPTLSLSGGARFHLGLILVVALAGLAAVLLRRSAAGVLVRAVGSNPRAVRAGQFSSRWICALAFAASGALAGLAGAVELGAVSQRIDLGVDQGVGYAAIAVALLARLGPLQVLGSAALFAVLSVGTESLQWTRSQPGLEHFASVMQGLVILALLWDDAARREAVHG